MTKAELIDTMFRDISEGDVEEGDDFILSGRGWNLYKEGDKYILHDCDHSEDYEIDSPEDIDELERHLNN